MGDLIGLYHKFGNPSKDLDLLFDNLFEQVFPQVKKMIQERWLKGKSPNGDVIGLYMSNPYSMFKNQKNPMAGFGVVDLTNTGEMGDKITFGFMDVAEYEIFSTVPYYTRIVQKYGEFQFNVTDKEKEQIFIEIATKISEITLNFIYNGKRN